MWRLFRSKPVIADESAQYIVDVYQWLRRHFERDETQLVLPTREFFPQVLSDERQAVEATFAAIKQYAGMKDWYCELVAQAPDVETKVAPALMVQDAPHDALGTFSINSEDVIEISYNPAIVAQPMVLVSTLAHELAHYLTATATEAPPGGWENWELVTDIAATFMGFGVFMANGASNFRQFSEVDAQGWQFNRNGYLTEAEHLYVLAIFTKLHNIETKMVLKHLKSGLRPLFKKALKAVEIADSL